MAKYMTSEGNSAVTVHCYLQMMTTHEIYFHEFIHKNVFLCGLYNKSLNDWSLRKQLFLLWSLKSH